MSGEIDSLQIQISADSESASQNVLALAVSLETLAKAATVATNPLRDFAKSLNSISGFKTTNLTQSATDISKAFQQFNEIGSIDNAVGFLESVDNLREATSSLSDVTRNAKELRVGKGFSNSIQELSEALPKLSAIGNVEDSVSTLESVGNISAAISELSNAAQNSNGFKIGRSFNNSIDALAEALPKLGKIGNVDDALAALESIENLEQATTGLRNISENISSLKVGKSFETNLESLQQTMQKLNEVGNTSAFAGGVEAISQAVERLNNIEVGQGFINLVQASTQWSDAIYKLNGTNIGTDFSNGIARVAKACEILNEVDFSGFKRMNDMLASLPDNVQVSFGASSNEIETLTSNLMQLRGTVESIQGNLSTKRGKSEPKDRPDYSWSNEDIKATLERAQASDKEVAQLKKVLDAYDKLGENVPQDIQEIAQAYGLLQEAEAGFLSNNHYDVIERANALKSVRKEIQSAINAYAELGERVPADLRKVAESYGILESRAQVVKNALKDSISSAITGAGKVIGTEAKFIMAPMTKIGHKFAEVGDKAKQFLASIKRIAMYRAVRAALKAITEGFEEGRKNLYYYSQAVGTDFAPSMDKAATAALYLKNSIGAATAPLTNYLVPMIDKAVDHIVELINKFNELTACLTGASTWTKAIKYPTTWQDELDDANDSAKKLKSTLLGFDELNVIEPTSTGGKVKGFTSDDYAKMFEEVRTDMTLGNDLPELLIPVKMAWDSEGDRTLDTIKRAFESILKLVRSIGRSFKKVWTNGTGQKTLETFLQITQNIVGTFGNLADGIRKAWDENERGTKLIQDVWDIANNVLIVFRDIWGIIRNWADSLNWAPILDSLDSLATAFKKLTDPNGGLAKLAKAVVSDLLAPLGKWLIEDGIPAAVDTLAAAFDGLADSLAIIEPYITPILNWLGKLAGFSFGGLSGLATSLTSVVDILMGKEISDDKLNRLDEIEKKLVGLTGGENSWYGKLWKTMESWGSHELGDALDEYKELNTAYRGIIKLANDLKQNTDGTFTIETDVLEGENSVADLVKKYKKLSAEDVEEMSKAALNSFTDAISNAKEEASLTRSGGLLDMLDSLRTGYDDINKTIVSASTQMRTSFETEVSGMRVKWEAFTDYFRGITETVSYVTEQMKSDFSDSIEGMQTVWAEFSSGFDDVDFFGGAIDNMANDWINACAEIENGAEKVETKISSVFSGMSKLVTSTWNKIKSEFRSGFNYIVNQLSAFTNTWNTKFDSIKKTVELEWKSVDITIESKWSVWAELVSNYAGLWFSSFKLIKDTVTDAWKYVCDKLSGTKEWNPITNKVTEFKKLWQDGMASIVRFVTDAKDNIGNGFKGAADKISKEFNIESFKGIGKNIVEWIGLGFDSNYDHSIGDIVNARITGLKEAFGTNGFVDLGKNILSGISSGLSDGFLRDGIYGQLNDIKNSITDELDQWVYDIQFSDDGSHSINELVSARKYNVSNAITADSLSIVGKDVADAVDQISSKAISLDSEQIKTAVYNGVKDAVLETIPRRESTENGKTELHVYLDRQEITAAVEQQQRSNGVSIMSGVVY
jgi:hypothetical protein